MNPRFIPCLLWVSLIAFVPCSVARAQANPTQETAPVDIDVANVRFDNVRAGAGSWYEVQIELITRAGAAVENKRFLDRVKVTLSLGIFSAKAPPASKVPDTYYRASAEAVAIEATGGRVTYRFYLPPEIVKRDSISGAQKFYLVEVSVGGKQIPVSAKHVDDTVIKGAAALGSFRSEIAAKAPANDGILLPQHLSPFAFDGTRPSPTMIRVETNR